MFGFHHLTLAISTCHDKSGSASNFGLGWH